MTLSNADKIRFAEVEDRITREFGDSDTMDFLEYLKQRDVENDLRQDNLEESIEFLVNECGELQKEVNEYRQQEEAKLKVNFKKLSPTAITPTKAHITDAGFDLYADEEVILKYGETTAILTNIAIELPEGYVADVRPRSGLTLYSGLRVHYGTIDSGYRNGIGIICENGDHGALCNRTVRIKKGQKIAQLVILPIPEITLQEVEELSDSDRGVNGFGSTGI
jgi:dUTP pyrophosphatase